MCKNKIKSVFKDDEKWSSLNETVRNEIIWSYRSHGNYFTNKSRKLSDLLYNWLFILNSGGLVSVVTLLTSKCDEGPKTHILSMWMGISFIIGLILIYIATKFSRWQSERKGKNLDSDFLLLQNDQITVPDFEKNIYSEIFPCDILITIIEFFSLIAFIIGLIIGFKIVS